MEIRQYDLVLVNLAPTIGSEMKKTRPCLVISPNEMNKYLQTIVIASVTSTSRDYPTRVSINQERIKGWIVIDQIRTIDKRRIVKILGKLNNPEIEKVKDVIQETFVE
ncbi:MAG: type II toxin-antitoxin system PemK/MazF family toxin [Mariniphaga sp.]|jgi:mRNA interferase MazF|nr:type II toxin-antitoxin system PemK/MazF family toxin [Mariniphaga sp.]